MDLSGTQEKEYILGTGKDELERLGLQHRVWADAAVGSWKRAGLAPGHRVLDLGCGPGHATFDLAQLVTDKGAVVAVDESPAFVNYVGAQAEARGLKHLQVFKADVESLVQTLSAKEKFDVVYCRWVLCWLRNPEKALAGVKAVLRPGGRFVIHDYFNWQTMKVGPRSGAVEQMVAAAIESFRINGADLDIAGRLPALLRQQGFRLVHFEVHQRVARGGGQDSTLAWPLSWWRTYGPKLVKQGFLAADVFAQAEVDLLRLERDQDQFFFCPPVFEFIVEPA